MIGRRGVLAGGAALTVAANQQAVAADQPDLRFEVMRNGSRIGHHAIRFRREGAVLEATIEVDIVVRFGPIVLYRYLMQVREVWRDGAFVSLESETNDDGTRHRVKAMRVPDQVIVDVSGAQRAVFPPNTIPLTHWNNQCMSRPLFNPQDGVAISSNVIARGEASIALADGREVRATRFSLIDDVVLDDWYDTSNHWTALRAPGRDGSTIDYRRSV